MKLIFAVSLGPVAPESNYIALRNTIRWTFLTTPRDILRGTLDCYLRLKITVRHYDTKFSHVQEFFKELALPEQLASRSKLLSSKLDDLLEFRPYHQPLPGLPRHARDI